MESHKQMISDLQASRKATEDLLKNGNAQMKDMLRGEIRRMTEDMRSHYANQKTEHGSLQQQLNTLKDEKTDLQKHLLGEKMS